MNDLIFSLDERIGTNYSGYNQLTRFYHFCLSQRENSRIHLDFSNVEWFDGNLCALLWAMIYQIKKLRGHTFSTDAEIIKHKLDVLYRNGFLNFGDEVYDDRQSTIPIQAFDPKDKESFCNYVENQLLTHRGIPNSLNDVLKERISDDLLEVFCNTNFHANTVDPFFVGGQYYPKQGLLKFTMVDLGDGFCPRINKATQGVINTDLAAILWALEGNSSKKYLDDCPGGLGLKGMLQYCNENKGVLQVISGNGYWSTDLENTVFQGGRVLPSPFLGATINLFFSKD